MYSTLNFKKLSLFGSMLATAMLIGCGADDSVSSPVVENQPPTVKILGQNRALERESITIKSESFDIDGEIKSINWIMKDANGTQVAINGASTSQISFVAPSVSVDEVQSYTIEVTVSDGELTASQTMVFESEAITQELYLYGQVVDEPIRQGKVFVDVGDQQFGHDEVIETDASGNYNIKLIVDERNFDSLVKVTAYGNEKFHPGVVLVSLLPSFSVLKEQATSLDGLGPLQNFAANVTNVSTAQYILAQKANSAPIVTQQAYDREYAKFIVTQNIEQQTVEYGELYQQALEMAAVIKAFVDNEVDAHWTDYKENSTSFDLALDNDVYLQALARVQSESGLLERIKFDILGDDTLIEYPDVDADGIQNRYDRDQDNDGIPNRLASDKYTIQDPEECSFNCERHPYPEVRDYFPLDKDKWAAEIRQLDFIKDVSSSNPDGVEWFKVCIRESINKSELVDLKDANTAEDWLEVSVLDVVDLNCQGFYGLQDFSPLKYFVNLEKLTFTDTGITTLEPLSELSKFKQQVNAIISPESKALLSEQSGNPLSIETSAITELKLNNSLKLEDAVDPESGNNTEQFADFSPLMSLPNLEVLELNSTTFGYQADSLSFITNAVNLIDLDLSSTRLSNLDNIVALTKLSSLNIAGTNVTDLTPLSDSMALVELYAHDGGVVDLPDFSKLTNLEKISFQGNDIANLDNLRGLTVASELTVLNLSDNKISDISALSGFSALLHLNLSKNELSHIDELATLPLLERLELNQNNLDNVAGIKDSLTLTELYLSKNKMLNLDGLSNLVNLTALDLSANSQLSDLDEVVKLSDISVIAKLINLEVVNLSYNSIVIPTGIDSLTKLTNLNIRDNIINDSGAQLLLNITPLPQTLNIRGNEMHCDFEVELSERMSLSNGDFIGTTACITGIEIKTDGPFGIGDPEDEDYLPAKVIHDVFYLDDSNIGRSGTWTDVGITEMYACQKDVHVCWAANGPVAGNFECIAEEESTYATCTSPPNEDYGYPGHTFTLDFQLELLPNNAFATTFNDRIITTLFKAYPRVLEADGFSTVPAVSCEYNTIDEMYDCILAFDNVTGPEIKWQQDHQHPRLPRCSGTALDTVATCKPAWSIIFNEATRNSPSFDVDLSDYQITPYAVTNGGAS